MNIHATRSWRTFGSPRRSGSRSTCRTILEAAFDGKIDSRHRDHPARHGPLGYWEDAPVYDPDPDADGGSSSPTRASRIST